MKRTSILNVLVGIVLLAITAAGAGYSRHVISVRHQQKLAVDSATVPPVRAALPAATLEITPRIPADTPGELRLLTTPAGAKVEVDRRSSANWKTPMTLRRLAPGSHTVMLSKPGFVSEIRVVDVDPGKTTVLELQLPARPR